MENDLFDHIREQYLIDITNANELGVAFIPNCSPGFNDRAVRLEEDHYPIPRRVHPDSSHTSTFSQYFDLAVETMDPNLQAITINSWNEWYEDSNIEPVERTGTTSEDNGNGNYTEGYEYVGYGTDFLEVIRDKKAALEISPISQDNSSSPILIPFSVYRAGNQTILYAGFAVEKVKLFELNGSFIGSYVVENGSINLDVGYDESEVFKDGMYLLQVTGAGNSQTFKVMN